MKKQKKKSISKKVLKVLSILFVCLLLAGIAAVCLYFFIRPYTGDYIMSNLTAQYSVDGTVMTLSCTESEYGTFFAFPEGCGFGGVTYHYSGRKEISVNGSVLKNGEISEVIKEPGIYNVKIGKKSFKLIIQPGSDMPMVYIETASGSLDRIYKDKEYKEEAELTVFENGKEILHAPLKYIKGRGNSTWACPQKSFSIKFTDKTDLLGLGKAKKFSLLTSWYDGSYMCNELGYCIAEKMGCASTPSGKSALLYINDEYFGIYCVSEPVEIGKERIDITDLDELNEDANPEIDLEDCQKKSSGFPGRPGSYKWAELPAEPDNIDGGYLLELDRENQYAKETAGFVTAYHQPVVIKSPEYASRTEVEFIRKIWTEAEEALYSETGYNSLNRHYSEYFDTESLAAMLLFQEFIMQTDVSQSSCFFYYNSLDKKIYTGPVWDLDYACLGAVGNETYRLTPGASWFAAVNNTYYRDVPAFFSMAARHPEIREAMFERWRNVRSGLTDEFITDKAEALWKQYKNNCVADCVKWNKMPGFGTLKTMADYLALPVKDIKDFCSERAAAFDRYFRNGSAVLYYNSAAGGHIIHNNFAFDGETVRIISDAEAEERLKHPFLKRHLKGWNTAPDGSGDWYYEGDTIKINSGNNMLYAQWK